MSTHHRTNHTRGPVLGAVAGIAALLLAGCSPSAYPEPPTLAQAIDAADALLAQDSMLEDVLVEPRPGRGSAVFTFPATESARNFRIQCLGAGEMTVRLDGEERFSDSCEDKMFDVGAYGVDAENNITRTSSESVVEVEATDDVYWVAALYTHSNGETS